MKPLLFVITLLCLSITSLSAQTKFALSPTPTPAELKSLFAATSKGEYDPFEVVREVAKRGKKSIPAASVILLGETAPESDSLTRIRESHSRMYALHSLQAIGTKGAYAAIFKGAETHNDPETRGEALSVLAHRYYYETLNKGVVPENSIIKVLLKNADDTSKVHHLHKTVAHIAREGLKNWLGHDFGDPDTSGNNRKVKVQGSGTEITIADYRKTWWEENKARVVWDREKRRFQIRK